MTDLYPGISSHMLKILNGEIKQSHVIPEVKADQNECILK